MARPDNLNLAASLFPSISFIRAGLKSLDARIESEAIEALGELAKHEFYRIVTFVLIGISATTITPATLLLAIPVEVIGTQRIANDSQNFHAIANSV